MNSDSTISDSDTSTRSTFDTTDFYASIDKTTQNEVRVNTTSNRSANSTIRTVEKEFGITRTLTLKLKSDKEAGITNNRESQVDSSDNNSAYPNLKMNPKILAQVHPCLGH